MHKVTKFQNCWQFWNFCEMLTCRLVSTHACHVEIINIIFLPHFSHTQFTAHPNCQQLLAEVWYRGLPGWRRQHWSLKIVISMFVGMSFPLLSIMYLVAPKTRVGNILRLPFLKFICHSASYLLFLVLLLMASLDVGSSQSGSNRADQRGPPPTDVECLIVLWVTGM